jgi:hypothetical protein
MARPHIEFIQVQALPWQRGLYGGARDDVETKILSIDDETGASTAIVRYPAGWRRDDEEYLCADEEMFLLAGDLQINDVEYRTFGYAYLPAGHVRRRAASQNGAVALTFFEGEPRQGVGGENFRADGGLVEHIDTNLQEWKLHTSDPKVPTGLLTKTQRIDPDSQDRTWLNARQPGGVADGYMGPREYHPVVEEMFVLSGDLYLERGVMRAGGYFWRPPDIHHGPFGTRCGMFMLGRSKGGPLVNYWTEEKYRFTFDPPHRPDLPPELEQYGRQPYRGLEPF